ncbi:MAG: alpha-L-arabinofuranosidase B [Acidobacteriaceae bacterium]
MSSGENSLAPRIPAAIMPLVACMIISCGSSSSSDHPIGNSTPPTPEACDIYAAGGTPCVAAHSMTRALFGAYNGPLYQVQRSSDGTTLDIGLLAAGGYAAIAPQDSFCVDTYCIVTRIYDQTANHNDLTIEGAGGNGGADVGAAANALPVEAGGNQVYGLSISAGQGYRNDVTKGVATNGQPEGMYMVTSGTHVNAGCCFDYGNAETSGDDTGNGHMDAVNFSTACWSAPCYGDGPWVQADLENGLFQSDEGFSTNASNTGIDDPFVTAMLKNDGQTQFELRSGNAQSGVLTTEYAGGLPVFPGYAPMHQEGAIVLGTGGDNSNGSIGSFFEGVMTSGFPSDATEAAVQANIVSVGYDTATNATSGTLAVGSEVSLQVTLAGLTNYYLRHEAAMGTQIVVASELDATSAASDLANGTWVVRRGFANANCFSFEARDQPGEFIRHFNFVLYAQPYDGSLTNAGDATFCAMTGNAGSGTSFQSSNYPTRYIRQFDGGAFMAADGGNYAWDVTAGWAQDTTFVVTAPLAP